MQKRVAIGFVASCVALFMTLNLGALPPPSDYNKNNAVFKAGKLADEIRIERLGLTLDKLLEQPTKEHGE